jgi:cell division septation protein DedD
VLFFSERYSIPSDIRKWLKKLRKESRIFGIIWSQDILIDSAAKEKRETFVSIESKSGAQRESLSVEDRSTSEPTSIDTVDSEPAGGDMTENDKDIPRNSELDKEPQDDQVITPATGKRVNLSRKKDKKGFELLGPILVIFVVFVCILAGLLWWGGYFDGSRDVIVLQREAIEQPAGEVPPAEEGQPVAEEGQPLAEEERPPSEGEGSPGEEVSAAAVEPPPPAFPPVEYQYTINIASYTDEKWAKAGLDGLAGKGLDAYLVPVDIRGKGMWMRLMIGSYKDKNQAQSELDGFIKAGMLEDGRVIRTPFAFLVGEWDNRAAATSAMKPLFEKGVFPYMVLHEEQGVERCRIFIGAFQGREQAVSLEKLLKDNGLSLKLVEREA